MGENSKEDFREDSKNKSTFLRMWVEMTKKLFGSKFFKKELSLQRSLVWMCKTTSKIKEVQVTTHHKLFSYKTTENISCLLRNRHYTASFKLFPY